MVSPLVSVILPVYNGAAFLRESIDSILSQTYRNLELVIIDDASVDRSLDVISSYSDKRIRIIRHDANAGLIATLNEGLQLAKGHYIARMDADDISHPDRLKLQVEFMEAQPGVALLGTQISIIGKSLPKRENISGKGLVKAALLFSCIIPHPTVMLRSELVRKYNWRYDTSHFHCEDFGLWNTIAQSYDVDMLPEILLKYRSHPGQVSVVYNDIQRNGLHLIRMDNLKRLGVDFNDREEKTFRKLMDLDFAPDENFLQDSERILLCISAANQKMGYVPVSDMNRIIGKWWYNLIGSVQKFGFISADHVMKSPLSSTEYLTEMQIVKIRLKSFLRRWV